MQVDVAEIVPGAAGARQDQGVIERFGSRKRSQFRRISLSQSLLYKVNMFWSMSCIQSNLVRRSQENNAIY